MCIETEVERFHCNADGKIRLLTFFHRIFASVDLAFLHLCQVKLIACNSIRPKKNMRERKSKKKTGRKKGKKRQVLEVYIFAIYSLKIRYAWIGCIYFTRTLNRDGMAQPTEL